MSSLGKDLATIRKSQHLTLEDIQNAIKIPVHMLKSIEDDSIFTQSNQSKTYIRSFIRSYARFLRIEDKDIIQALDAVEEGNYRGQLLAETEDVSDTDLDYESEDPARFADPGSYDEPAEPEIPEAQPYEEEIEEPDPVSPKEEPQTAKRTPTPEDESSIDWADMGRRFNPGAGKSKAWIVILVIVLVAALGVTGYIYSAEIAGFFISDDTPEIANQTDPEADPFAGDSASLEQNNTPVMEDTSIVVSEEIQPPALDDTLTVAVYAAYGILEPVRVTSDFNWRTNPFWMEQGDAYNFDFRDTLLVRGQYSDLILLFNGHVIENPRQNYFSDEYNSIMITRSVLNQPRYLADPPAEFPLDVAPPDTIIYRVSF